MINFTLKQLRYFDALATHGHFGHAADVCAISQPALSMQIKELEAALGTALFERGRRRVRLTSFGEEFSVRVRDILRSVEDLSDLARSSAARLMGRLRLGVIPTIAPYLLPTLIARLSDTHADLDVHIRETMTPRLLEELSDGRIDAAIVALPISDPAFEEVALFDENFVFVRPVEEAHLPLPDADDLRTMRLLLLEEGHCFRDQALSFCNIPKAVPSETLDGSSLSTLVQMVGAGMGVTLIPEMAVSVEARSAPVAVTPFRKPRPSRSIGMIWRRTTPLAGQLQDIARIVGLAGAELRSRQAA